ncbi:MAG: cytochrome B [Flammeovirgaceae bacterium]|nr:cytochrome B [Flammeovirgaceae bacterium]
MYQVLLHSHSLFRYIVLAALILVIVKSLMGWLNKKPYTGGDGKSMVLTLVMTHLQALFGIILYFVSPAVKFGKETMSDPVIRYWTVEHLIMMLIAIVLITMARITSKKMTEDAAKHRRVFIFNAVALLIIILTISMSGRGIIVPN